MRSKFVSIRTVAALLHTVLAAAAAASEITVQALDQEQAPIADLVVWLTPLDQLVPPAPAEMRATVEQKNEEFNPYITVVRVGTEVTFPNRDQVQHHVYSLSRPAKFEIPLHGGDEHESVVLDTPGIIPVGCNIHDWMISHIVVVDTPWFGQIDAAGRLTIRDLPAGRYKVEAWHPRLRQTAEQEITLAESGAVPVEFKLRLRPDRRLRRAPDAGGSGY